MQHEKDIAKRFIPDQNKTKNPLKELLIIDRLVCAFNEQIMDYERQMYDRDEYDHDYSIVSEFYCHHWTDLALTLRLKETKRLLNACMDCECGQL